MAAFPNFGRIALAQALANETLHVAWGTGDGAWLSPPSEDTAATALQNEIGRRTVSAVGYCLPDDAGEIVLPDGSRWSTSVNPTRHLLVTVHFDRSEASSSVIREIGIFLGATVASGLPSEQRYFTPGQVTNIGRLFYSENLAPLYRSPVVDQTFEFVITL